MKNRAEKLESLKRRESIKTMQIFGNGEDFINILEATVENIKENLKEGVELKNIDVILDQLAVLQNFQIEIKNLRDSIKEIQLPDKVELDGLAELTKQLQAVSNIKEISLDKSSFDSLKPDNIFDRYKPAQTDENGSIKYFGYLAKDGSWFIMRESETKTGKKYQYSTGKGQFKNYFEKRSALEYGFIDEVQFDDR